MPIPFEVPAAFNAALKSGEIVRDNVLLRNVSSGQVVGHLQEAGRLVKATGGLNPISAIAGNLNPVSALAGSAGHVATNIQLNQIKDMLGGLQMMSTATLAVSALNVGVTVAGFAVIAKKLKRIEGKIDSMEGKLESMDRVVENISIRQRARDRASITCLMEQGDEAWTRKDSEQIWRQLTSGLLEQDHYFRALFDLGGNEAESIITDANVPIWESFSAHEALAHLVAARTQCLVLLNEYRAAMDYTKNYSIWLSQTYSRLTPPKIVDSRIDAEAKTLNRNPDHLRLEMLNTAQTFLQITRNQQEFSSSIPQMISILEKRRIDGREYVGTARESNEPILILTP